MLCEYFEINFQLLLFHVAAKILGGSDRRGTILSGTLLRDFLHENFRVGRNFCNCKTLKNNFFFLAELIIYSLENIAILALPVYKHSAVSVLNRKKCVQKANSSLLCSYLEVAACLPCVGRGLCVCLSA